MDIVLVGIIVQQEEEETIINNLHHNCNYHPKRHILSQIVEVIVIVALGLTGDKCAEIQYLTFSLLNHVILLPLLMDIPLLQKENV
jgi:hypothetical protein